MSSELSLHDVPNLDVVVNRRHYLKRNDSFRNEIPEQTWKCLCAHDDKRFAYGAEPLFRESYYQLARAPGLTPDSLARMTYVLCKPDAIASRQIESILQFLDENDFDVVSATKVQLSRAMVAEMWRHNWNTVTIDRALVSTEINTITPALVLGLVSREQTTSIPASVRLSDLKGSAQKFLRREGTLRHILNASNPMLVSVHAPDEPADVVREAGILFSWDERQKLFASLTRSGLSSRLGNTDVREVIRDLYNSISEHRIDVLEARFNLHRHALSGSNDRRVATRFLDYVDFSLKELGLSWPAFVAGVRELCPALPWWDSLIIGAHAVFQNYRDDEPLVQTASVKEWAGK